MSISFSDSTKPQLSEREQSWDTNMIQPHCSSRNVQTKLIRIHSNFCHQVWKGPPDSNNFELSYSHNCKCAAQHITFHHFQCHFLQSSGPVAQHTVTSPCWVTQTPLFLSVSPWFWNPALVGTYHWAKSQISCTLLDKHRCRIGSGWGTHQVHALLMCALSINCP